MRKSLPLLAALALGACAGQQEQVWFSPQFSMADRAQILRAVNEAKLTSSLVVVDNPLPGGTLADTMGGLVQFDLRKIGFNRDLCGIALHEIEAHVQGRGHADHGVRAAFYNEETRCGR